MKKIFSGILAAVLFMMYLPAINTSAATLSLINSYKAQIVNLINDCTAAKISTDYEKSALAIIEKYSQELTENPKMEEYILDALERICERTVDDLTDYLAGKKQASAVGVIENSKLKTSQQSFLGTVSKNGETYEKPVFLSGVGHWKQVREDLEFLEKSGLNFVQTEVSMGEVLKEPVPADNWEIVRQNQDSTSVSQSSDYKLKGSYSLCITETNTDYEINKLTAVHQKVSVEPSTTYKYAFFVKRKDAQYFWFSLKGRSRSSDCYRDLSMSGEDSKMVAYSGAYTTGPNETELDLTFVNEASAGYIYIDDIFLRKEGDNTNLVKNPSFEELTETDFQINHDVVEDVRTFLENAAKHHIKVDLLISTHNEPEFLLGLYPELEYSGYGFFSYDPLMPKSREMIKKYLQALCGGIKDCTALNSICISNEPAFNTSYEPERYNAAWQQWLKNEYGTIENLNTMYISEYEDFDELDLTVIQKMNKDQKRKAMYKDYKNFNENLFTQWHAWIASVIKEVIPTVFVHCKAMNYMGMEDTSPGLRNETFNGANYELFSKFSDLNGCDAMGHIQKEHQQFVLDMLYDLHGSIKNAPVINSENHIIRENSHEAAQYAYSATWQGAVHGLGASAAWIWDEQYEFAKQDGFYDDILQLKPEHLWQLSRATMDMNRLSDELSAVQNVKPEIGILYSEAARIYSFSYMNSVYMAYKAVSSVGERVRFITDTGTENLNDLKLIIIPNARSVTDDVLNAIKDYKGKLFIIGEHSLTYTENLKPRVKSEVQAALSGSETKIIPYTEANTKMTSPTTDEIEVIVNEYVKGFGRAVSVTEAQTNDIPSDVSWTSTIYQGKKLVNICNYGVNPVKLNVSGATAWENLITGEVMSGEVVAKANTPMLLLETEAEPAAEEVYAVSKLMPVTPILKYRGGYKASWVNPDNNHITKISLYKVNKNGEKTIVYDEFSTAANEVCSYHADKTHTDASYFIIVTEFDNAPLTEFVLGGIMRAGLGGEWVSEVNNLSDNSICYQFENGYTVNDARSGTYALSFAANYKEYDGSYVSINAPKCQYSVEEGKKYRVSLWMKSNNVSSVLIKPNVLPEKRIIGRIVDKEYFSETRNDWRYYYYDTTAEATAVSEGTFEIVFDEMANKAIIDDISIYELGSNGEPVGENLFTAGGFEGIDATECGKVTNIELTKDGNGTVISWEEPEDSAFAAVKVYVNGQLTGKLMKGIKSIRLESLEADDEVKIKTVDIYGIEEYDYPVRFSQNGVEAQELKGGVTYEISSDINVGRLYVACYGEGNELYNVFSVLAKDVDTVTIPYDVKYLKTFIWNEDLYPLMKGRIWEIK